ncbi:MAG: DUF86 domain-containing protein [Nitrospirae bacterium]|nr:MAG: DUF86 domain-containing protein [Nitrospirota bacterium]
MRCTSWPTAQPKPLKILNLGIGITLNRWPMVDRDRILAKIDMLDGYLEELGQIVPGTFAEYRRNNEKRRACERLLQIATETVLDICHLLVTGLRLGLPGEEDDIFEKLHQSKLLYCSP